MKNVFIVLLVAAVGAGIYFYFSKTAKTLTSNSKELILGTWKLDSVTDRETEGPRNGFFLAMLDSSVFEFRSDTLIFQSIKGKYKDTSQYKFSDDRNFIIWKTPDTVREKWNIARLDSTTLILKDTDSTAFRLQRIKE
jgi:hypothetical protein